MAKKRRLGDLYVVGKSVTFDDGFGDPVEVYIRKLTPLDQEAALKAANAKRAVTIARLKDKESAEHTTLYGELDDLSKGDIVEILTESRLAAKREQIEAEVEADEKWAEEGYLDGLIEAWETDDLKAVFFAGDPSIENEEADAEDVKKFDEAARVKAEMDAISEAYDKAMEEEREDIKDTLTQLPLEDLRDELMKLQLDAAANSDWFAEYRRQELFYAVREPDTKKRYFESRSEVDGLSLEVIGRLVSEYQSLEVSGTEGKD